MRKGRIPTWLVLMVAAGGLLVVTIPGLWVFVSLTAKPLHPNPESVPTVMDSAPLPKWAGAVKQGRQIVRASAVEQYLPGVSVAVGIAGDIGTASTAFTSAAAGLLLQAGRLKLDDEIQRYVTAFPKKQWPVTVRQLMGHTAGIVTDGGDEGPLFAEHCERPVEALQYFPEKPLLFEPGTQYGFSRYGWILVSAAIEAAADQPFLEFMRERIFDPAGMRSTIPDSGFVEAGEDFPLINLIRELIHDPEATRKTTPDSTTKPMLDRVTSYFPRFAADPTYGLHVMRPLDYSCYAGSSVFQSTPSDLVRFGMAIDSGKLLRPATVELLQTSQRLASGEETGYGLGWSVKTVTLAGKQTRAIGHDGDLLGGMVASLTTFPEYGIVVAVTSNISYADTFSMAVNIAEAFVEQGKSPASK